MRAVAGATNPKSIVDVFARLQLTSARARAAAKGGTVDTVADKGSNGQASTPVFFGGGGLMTLGVGEGRGGIKVVPEAAIGADVDIESALGMGLGTGRVSANSHALASGDHGSFTCGGGDGGGTHAILRAGEVVGGSSSSSNTGGGGGGGDGDPDPSGSCKDSATSSGKTKAHANTEDDFKTMFLGGRPQVMSGPCLYIVNWPLYIIYYIYTT